MADGYIWGEASVTYPDWNGTVQLDYRVTNPRSLEQVVGLNPDDWFIIGLHVGGDEHRHELRVIAIEPLADDDTLISFARRHGGEIPATEFLIHNVDPYQILQEITHSFDLRLRPQELAGQHVSIRIIS